MEFRKIVTFAGPNVWSRLPVLQVSVAVGSAAPTKPAEKKAFAARLLTWLPTLNEPEYVAHLEREPNLAHIVGRVALTLHTVAGWPVTFFATDSTDTPGLYQVVFQYEEESLGRARLETAKRLVLAALGNLPFDVGGEIKKIYDLGDSVCLGPSTRAIVNAAATRGIPVRRLTSGSLVQLGQGARQRRIRTAETDRTGAVAETIASDKELTKTLLRAVGVPVPEGRPVDSPEDAWEAAQEIGPPVVVKPRDGNHGRGVFTGLMGCEQVKAAFEHAAKEGEGVLVERFALGSEHRLLVVGDRVVAATRGDAAQVVGDDKRTIAQLIEEQINSDPRRGGEDDDRPLARIELDPTTLLLLEQQGFRPESIPPAGKMVLVQHKGNLSIDVTDQVHPEVAARAVEAARVVGLDVAGLDLVVEDISKPLETQGGVVVEVNAGPSLQIHLEPSQGIPRPVGEAIVDVLFADGQSGRIPIAFVAGDYQATPIAKLLAKILTAHRDHVGLATGDGLFLNERQIRPGDCATADASRQVLLNPQAEAAVLVASTESIVNTGIGCELADVIVFGRLNGADQGAAAATTAVLAKTLLPNGVAVLPTDEKLAASVTANSSAAHIYFSLEAEHPLVARNLAGRGRAVFVQQGVIKLADSEFQQTLVALERIAHRDLVVCLAAAAAAWALGTPIDLIASGLQSPT